MTRRFQRHCLLSPSLALSGSLPAPPSIEELLPLLGKVFASPCHQIPLIGLDILRSFCPCGSLLPRPLSLLVGHFPSNKPRLCVLSPPGRNPSSPLLNLQWPPTQAAFADPRSGLLLPRFYPLAVAYCVLSDSIWHYSGLAFNRSPSLQ